ncbi:hypothetical protein [Altericroceibacterium xinjiangense]|uniref:hypothetical protein n=1 Tax=Altericroceibacterium xinjiangense TaxID=762261 RepID=UPI000F7EE675|nr:hypothetical protein [Altericroceibacterium xinjiangense]
MSARIPPPDLNTECLCLTVDRESLRRELAVEADQDGFFDALASSHPNLFSGVTSFIPVEMLARMRSIVSAIEDVVASPGYVDAVLAYAPDIARVDHGARGAFMGYDFHLGPDGPGLIEINTNAGGAFLNAVLARAQRRCCGAASRARISPPRGFEAAVAEMLEAEWRTSGRTGTLHRIGITDDRPSEQYLYPAFTLARQMLLRLGYDAEIVDASAFRHEGNRLLIDGRPVDLVYNRLTDFALEELHHLPLRSAYLAGDVVLTPNPRNHALYADKRNLILLSDPARLAAWGIREETIEVLQSGIPRTVAVTPERAGTLWADRKHLFFKPARGHGSKAAYRGDKLTRGVWAGIVKSGDFVAQVYLPPGERMMRVDEEIVSRKMDVRLYTYGSELLLTAARLYQGQATNMRTPGGGFAPVLLTGADEG